METARPRTFPQLDGIRGIAALIVLARHYWPGMAAHIDPSHGRIGADIFFVLSGFLITRSLLRSRSNYPDRPWANLRAFYIRRARRIIPLYYGVLLLVAWCSWKNLENGLRWHLAFLSNWFFIREGRYVGAAGHLWAIAVEQHFYLVWPLVILFIPQRFLLRAVWSMIGIGVLFHAACGVERWNSLIQNVLTPGACESLGAGALLCFIDNSHYIQKIGLIGLGLLLFRWVMAVRYGNEFWPVVMVTELSRSLVLTWIIYQGCDGFKGWLGRILESRPGRALGRYSFALYLIHNFVITAIGSYAWRLGPIAVRPLLPFTALLVTVLFSPLCYHIIEEPFR